MSYKIWCFLWFWWGCSLKIVAQTDELPYTSISLQNLDSFAPAGPNWQIASDVFYDVAKRTQMGLNKGDGILVNLPSTAAKAPLTTKLQHGDLSLELDIMLEKDARAVLLLQGRYGLRIADSWGAKAATSMGCGAVEERWNQQASSGQQGYEGHPAAQNVGRAPGLWQHCRLLFRAPRFNQQGEKIANARFMSVTLNGVLIQENIEITGPTHASLSTDEKAMGPLTIQPEQGSLAIRNIRYKAYGSDPVSLSNLTLSTYEGAFTALSDLSTQTPKQTIVTDFLVHQGSGGFEKFGGKLKGTIHLPTTGKYLLKLNLSWIPAETDSTRPNGGGELTINGKKVLDISGKQGGTILQLVDLQAGNYPVEIAYYKTYGLWYARGNNISLAIEGPGVQYTTLNEVIRVDEPIGPIRLQVGGQTTMQRGFINHKGKKHTHAIAVGEPGQASYSLDLQKGELLQVWRGDFLATTSMWHGRGETQLALPLGSVLDLPGKPSVAFLTDQTAAWPDSNATYKNLGYDLSPQGRPIFKSTLGTVSIRTSLTSADDGKKLIYSLAVTPSQLSGNIWCRIAEGSAINQLPNGLYAIDDKQFYLELTDGEKPLLRTTTTNRKELLLPLHTHRDGVISYSIIW